jgi:hypothetical protein
VRNAQLWRRILNEGLDPRCVLTTDQTPLADIQRKIITAPIFLSSISGDMSRDMPKWKEFRSLSIPFDSFWMEGAAACEFDDGMTHHIPFGVLASFDREAMRLTGVGIVARRQEPPEVIGKATIGLNEDFSVRVDQYDRLASSEVEGTGYLLRVWKDRLDLASRYILWPLCALLENLTILGCKNISLEPRENEPQQVRRAIKRYGGDPDSYRYHVLVVRPPGARKDSPAQEIGVMPRHVCRGHFAEYGPEFNKGLLFGKHAGRFYVPPHMKGEKKNGVVEKDYEVAAV